MLMQCQRPCSKIRNDQAENNHEITAEVQGNYPNLKRKIISKRNFCHLKRKSAKASRCLTTSISEQQGSKKRQLGSEEIGFRNQKIFTKSRVFSIKSRRKLDQKEFRKTPMSQGHSRYAEDY